MYFNAVAVCFTMDWQFASGRNGCASRSNLMWRSLQFVTISSVDRKQKQMHVSDVPNCWAWYACIWAWSSCWRICIYPLFHDRWHRVFTHIPPSQIPNQHCLPIAVHMKVHIGIYTYIHTYTYIFLFCCDSPFSPSVIHVGWVRPAAHLHNCRGLNYPVWK